jgi:hypothetical protein
MSAWKRRIEASVNLYRRRPTMKWFGTLIVCLVPALAAAAEPAGTALLANGGFEEGLDGWVVYRNSPDLKVELDAQAKAEGKQSLRVSKPGALPIDVVRQDVTVPAGGGNVKVSASVRASGAKNAFFKFFAYDASGNVVVKEDVDLIHIRGTFDWKKVERTYSLPPQTVSAEVKLLMVLGGTVWLDDIRVAPTPAGAGAARPIAAPGLISNGGFEKGVRGWIVGNNSRKLELGPDTENKIEGEQSLRITKEGGLPMDIVRVDVNRPPQGKAVTVSAMVKAQRASNAWLKFFIWDDQGTVLVEDLDIAQITGTFDWKKVDRQFTIPSNATKAAVQFWMVMDGTVWLDDVRVELVR